jgi:hypothetical protein
MSSAGRSIRYAARGTVKKRAAAMQPGSPAQVWRTADRAFEFRLSLTITAIFFVTNDFVFPSTLGAPGLVRRGG